MASKWPDQARGALLMRFRRFRRALRARSSRVLLKRRMMSTHGSKQPNAHAHEVNAALVPDAMRPLEDIVYAPPSLTGAEPEWRRYDGAMLVGRYPVAISHNGFLIPHSIFRTDERIDSALTQVSVLDQARSQLGRLGAFPRRSKAQATKKPLVSLESRWTSFGHWIPEHLLKLYWLKRKGELHNYRYLIEADSPEWKLDILSAAGIDPDDLVRWEGTMMRVPSLMVPDYPEPSKESLNWVRDLLSAQHQITDQNGPSRIYLSRQGQDSRRIINSAEVDGLLEMHGFHITRPETLTIGQQLQLCANCSWLIGPQGSAFTNQIFARKPIRVTEFFGASRIHLFNRQVSLVLGHTHDYLLDPRSTSSGPQPRDSSVVVDIDRLRELLEQAGSESASRKLQC